MQEALLLRFLVAAFLNFASLSPFPWPPSIGRCLNYGEAGRNLKVNDVLDLIFDEEELCGLCCTQCRLHLVEIFLLQRGPLGFELKSLGHESVGLLIRQVLVVPCIVHDELHAGIADRS